MISLWRAFRLRSRISFLSLFLLDIIPHIQHLIFAVTLISMWNAALPRHCPLHLQPSAPCFFDGGGGGEVRTHSGRILVKFYESLS